MNLSDRSSSSLASAGRREHSSTRNPVMLVHGLSDTSYKMRAIADYLHALGWQVYSIDLSPNNGDARLEVLAAQIAEKIDRTFAPQQQIDLIGFSMGGLVSRYYLQRLGGIDRVQRFISLSAPHQGTITAYFSLRLGCIQMRPASEFITDLNRDIHLLQRLNFTSMWTPFDLMILPPSSSSLGFGTEIILPIVAHALMVFDRSVLESIAHSLAQPTKSPI